MHQDPLAQAHLQADSGDHAAAIAIARQLETRHAQADPGDLESATTLLWVRLNLARWLAVQRQPDRRAALAVLDAAQVTWHSDLVQGSELAMVLGVELLSLRSFVLRLMGHAADSLAASRRAETMFHEAHQLAPETLSVIGRVPILLNQGAALADLGRVTDSLEPLSRALQILRAEDPGAHRAVQIELLVLRGTSLTLLGRFDEAQAAEAEAIALARPESGKPARHLLVTALTNHATTLTRMRRLDEAHETLREAMRVLRDVDGEPTLPVERRRWAIPLSTEAEILLAQGHKAQAARSARLAEPIMREYAEEAPQLVAGSLANVCLLIGESEGDPGYAQEALHRFTVLKEQFPGRYDFWWQRAHHLATALRERPLAR